MATIKKITVRGFKSIRELEDFELGNLNVLIGPNGSGKSNFIDVFKLLHYITTERLQYFVAKSAGADNLLYFGQKTTDKIEIKVVSEPNGYGCVLAPSEGDRLFFQSEAGYFYGDRVDEFVEDLGSGHSETKLNEYFSSQRVPRYVLKMLKNWLVYHFHDTSPSAKIKLTGNVDDHYRLENDASNLAAFLYHLRENHPGEYETIRGTVRLAAPFFDDFVLEVFNTKSIQLRWRHVNNDKIFFASSISDGTLRFICLATLLLKPTLPSVILLDEPELGLHPYAIELLASMLRSAATKTQVIVSTQSVTLVNKFQPEDIIVADRIDEETVLVRQSTEKLKDWLGEYAMGELWEKNVLGGRP